MDGCAPLTICPVKLAQWDFLYGLSEESKGRISLQLQPKPKHYPVAHVKHLLVAWMRWRQQS